MFELEKTDEVRKLIAITKSDSGISGPSLADAHFRLGELLAESMPFDPRHTTVMATLSGGIFFAEGIYHRLGCRFDLYDPKHAPFVRPDTRIVILADSVINTGRTIRGILAPDIYLASCVANRRAAEEFGRNLYTVRVSDNFFVGSAQKTQTGTKGPDTTMRLFNQL